jgi:hypothetical protein
MFKSISKLAFVLLITTLCLGMVSGQQLKGKIGSAKQWCSGWIDLQRITDFKNGDTLIIRVGGTATRVLVRLLARGEDPNSSSGIIGDARKIPSSRIIKVVLESDYDQIKQISVHGGPNPFDVPLGQGNGCATLQNVILRH